MRYVKSTLISIVLISPSYIFSQTFVFPLNKALGTKLENASKDSISFHSSIKPYSNSNLLLDTVQYKSLLCCTTPLKRFSYAPIVNLNVSTVSKSSVSYESGIGASLCYKVSKSLSLQSNIIGNINKFYPYLAERIDSYKVIPDWGRYLSKSNDIYLFPAITGIINYQPGKYITFSAGYDKHFFGDGYRSLLLSDNAAPFPFAEINVNFWRIQYMFMCSYLKDIDNVSASARLNDKYGVFHYLDINITKRLSIGIYEAIIWWGADPDSKRGFDPAYLNPVIFFRPVEYSMHSPDNANLGGNLKLRLWRKTFLYGQLFVDDLKIKELVSNSGWWGNKYGIQIGCKTYNLFNIRNLFVQSEFNVVRPYTYSHSSSSLNYGTMYQSLAHPLGANFREVLGILRYSKEKWGFMGKIAFAQIGTDTSKISFGQNIYKSYMLRNTAKDLESKLLQGKKELFCFADLRADYLLNNKWNINLFCSLKAYSLDKIDKRHIEYIFSIGISTPLYNNERDY